MNDGNEKEEDENIRRRRSKAGLEKQNPNTKLTKFRR